LTKASSRRTLGALAFQALADIHLLFVDSQNQSLDMANDLFNPLDFSVIAGYPHDLPEKAIDKLPTVDFLMKICTLDKWFLWVYYLLPRNMVHNLKEGLFYKVTL